MHGAKRHQEDPHSEYSFKQSKLEQARIETELMTEQVCFRLFFPVEEREI